MDARRERSALMNNKASCSDIGDGPGTGGNGEGGGRERGGFGVALRWGWTAERGVEMGVLGLGMWEGGAGKEESKSGTALRLSASRSSVVVVVDMAEGGGTRQGRREERSDPSGIAEGEKEAQSLKNENYAPRVISDLHGVAERL